MQRRSLLAAAALALTRPALAAAPNRILFWHAMNGALGNVLNTLIARFNSRQNAFEVVGVFKGGYPETLTAAIAAWRAGQAPHLVQVFDVGTGSMIAAGPAVKDVWQLAKETGTPIEPANYIASVRGYYSLPDGRMASMPFNSSTAVMWYNADAFEKAADPAIGTAAGDGQLARHQARQHGAIAGHYRRGMGEGARWPAGRQTSARERGGARQPGAAQFPAIDERIAGSRWFVRSGARRRSAPWSGARSLAVGYCRRRSCCRRWQ